MILRIPKREACLPTCIRVVHPTNVSFPKSSRTLDSRTLDSRTVEHSRMFDNRSLWLVTVKSHSPSYTMVRKSNAVLSKKENVQRSRVDKRCKIRGGPGRDDKRNKIHGGPGRSASIKSINIRKCMFLPIKEKKVPKDRKLDRHKNRKVPPSVQLERRIQREIVYCNKRCERANEARDRAIMLLNDHNVK